jgi:hypothetical protein
MGLEGAVANLAASLKRLAESIAELEFSAVRNRPEAGDSVLVDLVGNTSDDLNSLLRDARKKASEARRALGSPPDFDRLRRSLTACQEHYNAVAQRFIAELLCYDRIAALKRLGRERRGEWQDWAGDVSRAILDCQAPLHEANQAFFTCWQEIAERGGATNISVRSVSSGPQHIYQAASSGSGEVRPSRRGKSP